jgi:hypothetical protein
MSEAWEGGCEKERVMMVKVRDRSNHEEDEGGRPQRHELASFSRSG